MSGAKDIFRVIKTDRLSSLKLLSIKSKASGLIRLTPNYTQKTVVSAIQGMYHREGFCRLKVLKYRQGGCSTAVSADMFLHAISTPDINCITIAHDPDTSRHIFGMLDTYYHHLPRLMQPPIRSSHYREMIDFDKLGSSLRIMTASDQSGRGKGVGTTIHYLHISELSRWKNPEEIIAGISHAVPRTGSFVVEETTAYGVGNYHHREWLRAIEGKSAYKAVFLKWFLDGELRLPVPPGFSAQSSGDFGDEKALLNIEGMTLGAIVWRRWCLLDRCPNDPSGLSSLQVFQRDYPSTWHEAFQSSGKGVFDQEILSQMLVGCETGERGRLVRGDEGVIFVKDDNGPLTVWDRPRHGMTYATGFDPAKGFTHGDFSSGLIVDSDLRDIAEFNDQLPEAEFAEAIALLCEWYNFSEATVEANSIGQAVVDRLKQIYPKDKIYHRLRRGKSLSEQTEELGWSTDIKTKPLMISRAREIVNKKMCRIRSTAGVSEMMTFVEDEYGRCGAAKGCHDDRVMSRMMAWFAGKFDTMTNIVDVYREVRGRDVVISELPAAVAKNLYVGVAIGAITGYALVGCYTSTNGPVLHIEDDSQAGTVAELSSSIDQIVSLFASWSIHWGCSDEPQMTAEQLRSNAPIRPIDRVELENAIMFERIGEDRDSDAVISEMLDRSKHLRIKDTCKAAIKAIEGGITRRVKQDGSISAIVQSESSLVHEAITNCLVMMSPKYRDNMNVTNTVMGY